MEKQHILLKNIALRNVTDIRVPDEFSYKVKLGAWTANVAGTLLFNDSKFIGVASKKKDIEIGEDQK